MAGEIVCTLQLKIQTTVNNGPLVQNRNNERHMLILPRSSKVTLLFFYRRENEDDSSRDECPPWNSSAASSQIPTRHADLTSFFHFLDDVQPFESECLYHLPREVRPLASIGVHYIRRYHWWILLFFILLISNRSNAIHIIIDQRVKDATPRSIIVGALSSMMSSMSLQVLITFVLNDRVSCEKKMKFSIRIFL